jgi:hypothetical protein
MASDTRTVFAGAPDAMSTVVFDELTREMRITGASRDAGVLTLRAILGGAADLHPGEARTATIVVDPSKATVQAPFVGNDVVMQLQP